MTSISIISTTFYSFLLFFVCHIIVFWTISPHDRLKTLNRIYLFLAPLVVIMNWYSPIQHQPLTDLDIRLLASIIFLLLSLGFMAFYSGIEHSIRIRICIEVDKSDRNYLPLQELYRFYSPDEALNNRIKQLQAGGYIYIRNNNIQMTRKGLIFAKISKAGIRLLNIPEIL